MLGFFRRSEGTVAASEIATCSIDRALEMDQVFTNRALKTVIADYRQVQFGIKMGGQTGADAEVIGRLSERIRTVLRDECKVELDGDAKIDTFVASFPNTDAFID